MGSGGSAREAMGGPVLNTERLELRWLTPDDAPMMLAVWNDPAFLRYVGDRGIRTLEQARAAIEAGPLRLYSQYGYGPFRLRLRYERADVGICGLFHRDTLDEPDIGFAILPDYCGRGLGFESSVAVLDHAHHELGLSAVTAIVSPDNEASIRLLTRLGFAVETLVRISEGAPELNLFAVAL